jgi:hypothetical protein
VYREPPNNRSFFGQDVESDCPTRDGCSAEDAYLYEFSVMRVIVVKKFLPQKAIETRYIYIESCQFIFLLALEIKREDDSEAILGTKWLKG